MRTSVEGRTLEWTAPLDSESVEFVIRAEGYKSRNLIVDPGIPFAEVVLEDAEVVRGRVLSESGHPIAGAHVSISRGTTVDTGKDGGFPLAQADKDAIQITVRKPGYDEQQLLFGLGEVDVSIDIRLKRSGAGLFGRVIDDASKPVRNFSVRLNRVEGDNNETFWRWFDDEEGRFSLQ